MNGRIMNKSIGPITYNPFEPQFSVLSKKNSNGYSLEQRSNLMLRKIVISKNCVFWAPVGVSFVPSESCVYVRKMDNNNVIINQKFMINRGLKNNLLEYKRAVATSVLQAVRALNDACFEYENTKINAINPSSILLATLKVRLDKEKSITYIPRVTVTINFSGSQSGTKIVSRTLNKFNSSEYMKLIAQFVSYKNQCIDAGIILPITIADISVSNDDIKLLSERSKSIFERALTSYLVGMNNETHEIRGKILTETDKYTLDYGHGLVKSYTLTNYFNDEQIRLLVTRVCDFHMSQNAKNKAASEINTTRVNTCVDKIHDSSGLSGIIVALDRRNLCIVVHGIVGKRDNGSYKTKQRKIIDGNLKSAFNFVMDAHIAAFNLPTLSKKQYSEAYSTLQFAILSKVPDLYLSSVKLALEGVSSVASVKGKKFNDNLPRYEMAYNAAIRIPFKKTGTCGVNVEVNRSSSLVSATVSISPLKGRIKKKFSINTHGLFRAFDLAIAAYRGGFNLPMLTNNELEEAFIVFESNVFRSIPESYHYKLNKNFSTQSMYSDVSITNNSEDSGVEILEMTQEEARLTLAGLREKKEGLMKITQTRTESDKVFGIYSPVQVDVLTNCSACGHKHV